MMNKTEVAVELARLMTENEKLRQRVQELEAKLSAAETAYTLMQDSYDERGERMKEMRKEGRAIGILKFEDWFKDGEPL